MNYEEVIRDKIIEHLGKGSVVAISDETLLAATPTIYNGVRNCITLSGIDGQLELEGDPEEDMDNIAGMLRENEMYLTVPCCHRKESSAWGCAAEVLEMLAEACRKQEMSAKEEEDTDGGS